MSNVIIDQKAVNRLINDVETLRYELYEMEIKNKDVSSEKYREISATLRTKASQLDSIAIMHGDCFPEA